MNEEPKKIEIQIMERDGEYSVFAWIKEKNKRYPPVVVGIYKTLKEAYSKAEEAKKQGK